MGHFICILIFATNLIKFIGYMGFSLPSYVVSDYGGSGPLTLFHLKEFLFIYFIYKLPYNILFFRFHG